MKITLDANEIDQALVNYVRAQGLDVEANDIEITVADGKLSAAISTNALGLAVNNVPKSEPVPTPETATTKPEDDGVDREELKKVLDERGVEYAPKARTATLIELVESTAPPEEPTQTEEVVPAEEPVKEEKEDEDTGSLFGSGAVVPAEEKPPFYTEAEEKTESVDDDKPLFGA